MKNPYEVIQSAIISEKATDIKSKGKYVFNVANNANKIEIKKAIEKLYDVKVKSINILNVKGKTKRAGRMLRAGKRPDTKKAIVTLQTGEINFL